MLGKASNPAPATIYGERKRCPPRKARIYALFCCPEADIFFTKPKMTFAAFEGKTGVELSQ